MRDRTPGEWETIDDLDALLAALPPEIVAAVDALPDRERLIEVVMDLGRAPEARYPDSEVTLLDREVTEADIRYVVDHIGMFGDDNRAGIERTLHRISAIRNRAGKVVGLTCRVGRAVYGTIEIIKDFIDSGKSILIMGRPGIGKTTMLREAARVLADDLGKRVVVVDTSNEIAGDGDIPHPAIGKARRMQVRTPAAQHEVMIEAVENHMPQVIVIDEIGTELEAAAARTIAERGVQLIGTAHGNNLDNLMLNPTLSDLIGGIQSVTLGDEEARRRRTQKSVLERKAPPTFDVIVEIQDRDRVMVHPEVADTVDAMLRGDPVAPELRWRDEGGVHRSQARPRPSPREQLGTERFAGLVGGGGQGWRTEPGWRGDASGRAPAQWDVDGHGVRSGFRPGQSGGWRTPRGNGQGTGRQGSGSRLMPGERIARIGDGPDQGPWAPPYGAPAAPDRPFVAGAIADRGPLERGTVPAAVPTPEPRARDARELDRQREWRAAASRAIETLRAEEGTGPANLLDIGEPGVEVPDVGEPGVSLRGPAGADDPRDPLRADDPRDRLRADDEALADRAVAAERAHVGDALRGDEDDVSSILPTIRVLPFGISRKRLEQAIRELQLPVIVARDIDEAEVVMTLRSEYRQKTGALRDAEARGLPIYVLKSNTIIQMQSSLTSIFALEVDPREAALRETEEAIGLVLRESEPVELSPQNAYVRRLQHQMAERANVVSRSRGREPYRRVRLYPDEARTWR
jgi:stage III sporulation protein SpoIIIAA